MRLPWYEKISDGTFEDMISFELSRYYNVSFNEANNELIKLYTKASSDNEYNETFSIRKYIVNELSNLGIEL